MHPAVRALSFGTQLHSYHQLWTPTDRDQEAWICDRRAAYEKLGWNFLARASALSKSSFADFFLGSLRSSACACK
jgi:hypothetical protein